MKLLSALAFAAAAFAALGALTFAFAYFERRACLAWKLFKDGAAQPAEPKAVVARRQRKSAWRIS
jgi:hypothetical protein